MENGLLLIDKPIGPTSRAVDNLLMKRLKIRKLGHLGTLDPFASGLLVVAYNKATKFLTYLEEGKKVYEARLILGYSSSTLDSQGEIEKKGEIPSLSKEIIEEAFSSLTGRINQLAPLTSAHRVEGKRMYEFAHKGIEIERKSYEVEVHSLTLLDFDEGHIDFRAEVGKGCYVRVLGEDIAKKLGTYGYLESLRRTKVGDFEVKNAKKPEEIGLEDAIDPLPYVNMKKIEVDADTAILAKNGVGLDLKEAEEKILLCHEGSPVAVYRKQDGKYVSERGLF